MTKRQNAYQRQAGQGMLAPGVRWLLLSVAAASASIGAYAHPATTATDRIDSVATNSPEVPGAIVLVRHAGKPDWTHVIGVRAKGGSALATADEFRIASVTKTYVAAALLRLVEQHRLNLGDRIADRLSPPMIALLRRGGYDPDGITIANLLTHRAGLRDYATTAAYYTAVGSDPGHRWTPAEQIAMTMEDGPPLAAPDTSYAYSDAGYVLIGEIIERSTGQSLGDAVPALIGFARLGINHSYWEPVPDGIVTAIPSNRAHAYQDGVDTAAINPSFDIHGGGGLVATAGDVMTFFQALLDGRVFDSPKTLALMLAPATRPVPPEEGIGYGLGIEPIAVGKTRCWGHKGHWGTAAFWCPAAKAGFVVSINAAGAVAHQRARAIMAIAGDLAIAQRP
ncbi:serine hydrolase [Sphingomonas sp. 28-63-12]|uniref:serine hydrolase domain-containing protein n=1 Tax=Sphingomonas sp. 28-63-12 TaxID=1970434 RepID=UPI000BD96E14|nr:MAG: hypothetical protein B7Y47_11110 [Sphingomonas sp. 28-63-12]